MDGLGGDAYTDWLSEADGLGDIDDLFGADATFGAQGGPYRDLQNQAQSTPGFIAWAQRQGDGFTNMLEAIGTVAPDHWEAMAKAYSVQMNYIRSRWPSLMPYIKAAVWDTGTPALNVL
jgi:hypothetical protein